MSECLICGETHTEPRKLSYVRIGCHTIHVHEIERIAAQLGL